MAHLSLRTGAHGVVIVLGLAAVACGGSPELDARRYGTPVARDAGSDADPGVVLDVVERVRGVAARGRDAAVVALDLGGEGVCTGTLVSPRLVLTARHCLARTLPRVSCPPLADHVVGERDPRVITVLYGDAVDSARRVARGLEVVAPSGPTLCDADVALLVLDTAVTLAKPLLVRSRGVARGDRVRAVGFGRPPGEAAMGIKLVREHVRVLDVSPAEFTVGEATCQGDSGGPALDEDTGEVVGVVSRGGPTCEGEDVYNVYTRADAFGWLVEEAFSRLAEVVQKEEVDAGDADAVPKPAKRGTKQKPASDVGGACSAGIDCGAGVCAVEEDRSYCTRGCGPGDRCPTRFRCEPEPGPIAACLRAR